MKSRSARHASLVLVGAMLLLLLPSSRAFAAIDSLSSVSPPRLAPGATGDLVLHGSFILSPTFRFSPATGITINSGPSGSTSDQTINVTIAPNAATGARDVIVNDGISDSTCSKCFTVTPPPIISTFTPASLAAGGGPITYTITGTGFLSDATVQISGNGVSAGSATVAGDGKSLTVPLTAASTAVTGSRNVTVSNTDGQQDTCSACLLIAPPPHATGLFPAQRAAGLTNQVIDIIGAGFDATTSVTFASSDITLDSLQRVSATNLKATIDVANAAAPGSSDVSFANTDNGGHSVCTGCFSITGPTSVSITTPVTVNGPVVATFSQPVSGVSSSNTFLRLTGGTSNLAAIITCADKDGFATSCATGFVKTASLLAKSNLTPGQHYTIHIAEAGQPAITDFGGLTVAPTTMDFRGGLFQQAEGPATAYTWRIVNTSSAYGGSYVIDNVAGSTAAYGFYGSQITWYTNIGPTYGIADLYVDGVLRATVNCYSSSYHYRAAFTVSGFPYAKHTLSVRVRGTNGSRYGRGTNIAVDAFKLGSTLFASPSLTFTWGVVKASSASGGAYSWSRIGGSTATFVFRGTQVEMDTVTGPQMGTAKIYLDGVLKFTVDSYSAATTYNVAKIFSGLTDAVHTVYVVVTGAHRAASSASYFAIDRWVVT